MKTNNFKKLIMILGGFATINASYAQKTKPNVIFILADDLGYGDLSCYGQKQFSTPNIDRLATQGIRFTNHYAGNAVSAPSRCSLLTGLHSGHAQIRGNKELKEEGQLPLNANTYTIAKLMKQNGYATGAFGKWGLGYPGSSGDPNNQGFDEFYGYNCQRLAHRYYPSHLWHNQTKVILKENIETPDPKTYAPDLIHNKSLDFIRKNKDKAFFAYIPFIQPHAELKAPNDEILAQFEQKYKEKPFISRYEGANYGDKNFEIGRYSSQTKPRATFAAMVSRLDKYVGDIVDLLNELGIEDNTIIIFSSDNGPHKEGGADPNFFNSNGDFSGFKRDFTDGGIRVPMIIKWGNQIKKGRVSNHISAFWDILPTLADITNTAINQEIDGISFLATLQGKKQEQHEYLYWELKGQTAIRWEKWKAIKTNNNTQNNSIRLFNLDNDIEEKQDVADENPEIIKKMKNFFQKAHTPNSNFPLISKKNKKK